MPHLESPKKRLRQDAKRRARNKATRKNVRTVIKLFLQALKDGKKDEALAAYKSTCSAIDKAAIRGYLAKNAGARYKSRLQVRLNKMIAK